MVNLLDSWTAGQRVVRVGAADAVLATLRAAIEEGRIPIGSRLDSEAALAQQFGVSRTMVREALKSANALGLTVTRTGKGTFVIADRVAHDLKLGRYSARELMQARPHIEVPAASLAAGHRSQQDVETLRELLRAMEEEEELEQWVILNSEFHAVIARSSGNGVFASMLSDIDEALANQSSTLNQVVDRRKESDHEHAAIFEAIEKRSVEDAGLAMMRHLHGVGETLCAVLPAAADHNS